MPDIDETMEVNAFGSIAAEVGSMGRMPPIYRTLRGKIIVRVAGAVAFINAGISFWALWPSSGRPDWLLPMIVTFWTVGPPIWFFVEYAWIFDNWEDADAVARFKDLQTHAAKIWGGILALLTASFIVK